MDGFLRGFISRKWKIKGFSFTFLDILLAVCITTAGLLLRSTVITAYTPFDAPKAVGIVMEYLLAVLCAAVVYRMAGSGIRAFLTYSILVVYPTVVANGSLWNVNCVMYVFLFFMGIFLFVSGYRLLGVLSGFAGLIVACGRFVSWYVSEGAAAQSLTRGWPDVYEIIGSTTFVEYFDKVSWLFLAGLLATAAYCMFKKGVRVDAELAFMSFLFLSVLIPYFAPFMPAWAGYTADIALLIYCMMRPRRFYLPMLHIICSYAAYAYVINGETKLPMVVYAVILMGILANLGVDLYRTAVGKCRTAGEMSVNEARTV